MRIKILILSTTLVLVFIFVLAGCVTGNKTYNRAYKEEMVGTWINTDYENRIGKWAKVVIKPDGMFEGYNNAQGTEFWKAKITITDRWTDSEGNIFYKLIHDPVVDEKLYELWKLSNSGTVCELVWDSIEYPTDINPDDSGYQIYYRQ
jgi:hypothetical protein